MRAARLDDLAALAMLFGVAAVLAAALVLQFGFGEAPCPLCLLERVGMFGACFGLMMHFRPGDSVRAAGIGLVSATFLLVVSTRQVLLDIVPRPGHAYVGSAVLGLHMPVWAVVIAAALIAGFAGRLALFGAAPRDARRSPRVARLAGWAGLAVVALAAVNLAAVLLQCGFGECRAAG
ncbi:disulfide bond formation protein B [Lichenibacterium minor]|nr:disulfide bond formation protein B [Lichenibacterium minor]